MRPETLYTQSGDVSIAYQVLGDGPIDLVMAPGWISHVEVVWEEPSFERMMRKLTQHFRVLLFDKRGTGLSDRSIGASTLEDRMDDIRAVMDAAGSERAVILGWSEGGTFGAMFAATYPERTRALIIVGSGACFHRSDDFPIGWPPEVREAFEKYIREGWGSGLGSYITVPSRAEDESFRRWVGRYERMSISPSEAVALLKVNAEIDVRHVLPTVNVPTLVLHQGGDKFVPPELGRDLAERIPGAKLIELSGIDHLFWFGDQDETVDAVVEFVTGVRPQPDIDRVLATVLFADIVGSTEHAAQLGDHRWRKALDEYDDKVQHQLEQFRGRMVKTTGDGTLATFDGPARAIRCASAIGAAVRAMGMEVRCGLHTGEIELRGEDVAGIAVVIGQRVSQFATANEVLVSSTVKDLVTGAGIEFDDRGGHTLKGVPGEWRLYAVKG